MENDNLISQLQKFDDEVRGYKLKRNDFIRSKVNLKGQYLINFGSNKDIEEDRKCITGIKVLQQRNTFYSGGHCFLLQGKGFVSQGNSFTIYKNLEVILPYDTIVDELRSWISFEEEEFMKLLEEERSSFGKVF